MHSGLGCFRFARRYSGNRVCFLFLQLLRCFNSLRSLVPPYGFRWPYLGLPHSEIFGSMLTSSSPKRIVGNHVLLRLCVPRYPPLALISLTTNFYRLKIFWCLCFHNSLPLITSSLLSLGKITYLGKANRFYYLTSYYAVFKVLTGLIQQSL
jgi:hypothetical protein